MEDFELLLDKLAQVTGNQAFFNSGVLEDNREAAYVDLGKGFSAAFLKPGPRFNHTRLEMMPSSLNLPPHCHPGGEIATVLRGTYFDAGIDGTVIQEYLEGSIVVYGAFSTHRPLSRKGATISYTTLDGILFPGKNSEIQAGDSIALLRKMEELGAPKQALFYARSWMLT